MDQKALALLARFAATLRRAGLALDMVRFVNEDDYAMSVLDGAFQSKDESVVVTALSPQEIAAEGGMPEGVQLMHKPIDMGWLKGYLNALVNMGQMAKRQDELVRMREM